MRKNPVLAAKECLSALNQDNRICSDCRASGDHLIIVERYDEYWVEQCTQCGKKGQVSFQIVWDYRTIKDGPRGVCTVCQSSHPLNGNVMAWHNNCDGEGTVPQATIDTLSKYRDDVFYP